MMRLKRILRERFFNKGFDFRVRLFNVLAIAGCLVSIIATVVAALIGEGPRVVLTNAASGVFAYILLYYASKSGRYERCYLITIVGIFMGGFALMFFGSGGYQGAVPHFFVFAMVFTVFMLKGRKAFWMLGLEAAFYTALCIAAYRHPEWVTRVSDDSILMTDAIFGFITVGLSLGITMFLHFHMYDLQQTELEKAREEAMRHSEIKSAFLANMSHEIRTPINVILGMNEMVLRESRSDQITGYGLNIQKAGKTLLTLINNILDFSRIESGKLETVEESYRTADLLHELTVMGNDCAGKQGIPFHVEADSALPSGLFGGFLHIRQIAFNFISNAFKYTERGSVTLRIEGERGAESEELRLRIIVADTGIGIREEDLGGLFDAFVRVDLPAHRNIEGTGLGLAIAKELADLMGGRITVDSAWGEGSVFSLEVAQAVWDAAPIGISEANAAESAQNLGGSFVAPEVRILVVDDNRENLLVARSMLSRTMMRVDMAENGRECLEAVRTHAYHLILMDYMMPDMDGVETFRRLRMEHPGFCTPVAALTANAVAGTEQTLLREGFAAYLSKPVIWRELEDVIAGLLPAHLVKRTAGPAARERISEADRDALTARAAEYGLRLDEGLRYLNGDVLHYRHVAGFFSENYRSDIREAETLLRDGDQLRLEHIVHSLKSRAKAVGAQSLHDIAFLMEKKCRAGDAAYMENASALLFLEWERAGGGLERIAALIDQLARPVEPEEAGVEVEELLHAIRVFRYRDAEAGIARMRRDAQSPRDQENLQTIQRAIEALDFDLAESLLTKLCEEAYQ